MPQAISKHVETRRVLMRVLMVSRHRMVNGKGLVPSWTDSKNDRPVRQFIRAIVGREVAYQVLRHGLYAADHAAFIV